MSQTPSDDAKPVPPVLPDLDLLLELIGLPGPSGDEGPVVADEDALVHQRMVPDAFLQQSR